jgi:hypothetical protein
LLAVEITLVVFAFVVEDVFEVLAWLGTLLSKLLDNLVDLFLVICCHSFER